MKANRWTTGALLASVLLMGACQEHQEAPAPPRRVMVFEVAAESMNGGRSFAGEVRARQESALGFRLAGKLIERKVELGDVVRPGQVIARLDRTDPALTAQAAKNSLAAAEADLELARSEAKRYAVLRAKNYVSQSALDAKESVFKAADHRVQAAKAQSELAGNQAQYADLLSDMAGVVSAVLAEPGQVLSAGQPVVRVARTGRAEKDILISVAENGLKDLRPGRPVTVRLWADSEKTYRGAIREVSPQADPVTRTYAVKVGLQEADESVRLGMTANVLLGGSAANLLRIPAGAVVDAKGQPAVWILGADGRISARNIEVAAFREDGVLVRSGLIPGDRIVAAGAHKLKLGETVRPMAAR